MWSDCGMCGQECKKPCIMLVLQNKEKSKPKESTNAN